MVFRIKMLYRTLHYIVCCMIVAGIPDRPDRRAWNADKAVDGDTDKDPSRNHCAQMNDRDRGNSVWLVDLGEPHVVTDVTLFNVDHHDYFAMADLTVYVANTMSFDAAVHQGVVCGRNASTVPRGQHTTITCERNNSPIGRYVIVENGRAGYMSDRHLMTICEAVVMGYTPYDCTFCPDTCNPQIGCRECPQGRDLPDCQLCNSAQCDPEKCHCFLGGCTSGTCRDGCDKWYINADTGCNVHIAEPDLSYDAPKVEVLSPTDLDIDYEQFPISDAALAEYYQYVLEMKSLDGAVKDFKIIEDTRVNHTVYNLTEYTNATYFDPSLPAFNSNRIELRNLTAGGVYKFRIRPYRIIRETSWGNAAVASGIPSQTVTIQLDHMPVKKNIGGTSPKVTSTTTTTTTPVPASNAPRQGARTGDSMGGMFTTAAIVGILLAIGVGVLGFLLARHNALRKTMVAKESTG
jgi:hypothetical protein